MTRNLILSGMLAGALSSFAALHPVVAQEGVADDQISLTTQKETTLSRRLLMNSIGANNDIIHDILDGALPMDDLELRGRLQSISAMLYAFPSLYRVEANPYSEEGEAEDPAHVSLSNAFAWEDFETFKQLSYDGYLKAAEGSQARPEDMLARVEELEGICESCHDTYRTEFNYLDFDRLEDFLD